MKKWLICTLTGLMVTVLASAQEDRRLAERLDSALHYTSISDLEKLMDFTYPKLFTLVPKEQMLETLKSGLVNDEFIATVDSVKVVRIFPVFTSGKGKYAKLLHTMRLNMQFREALDTSAGGEVEELMKSMRQTFGEGKVSFNKKTNTVSVMTLVSMVAIKDEQSPEWTFVTFDDDEEDHELGAVLFPEEVLQKLKTYQ